MCSLQYDPHATTSVLTRAVVMLQAMCTATSAPTRCGPKPYPAREMVFLAETVRAHECGAAGSRAFQPFACVPFLHAFGCRCTAPARRLLRCLASVWQCGAECVVPVCWPREQLRC